MLLLRPESLAAPCLGLSKHQPLLLHRSQKRYQVKWPSLDKQTDKRRTVASLAFGWGSRLLPAGLSSTSSAWPLEPPVCSLCPPRNPSAYGPGISLSASLFHAFQPLLPGMPGIPLVSDSASHLFPLSCPIFPNRECAGP